MIVGSYVLHLYCANSELGGADKDTCKTPKVQRGSPHGEADARTLANAKKMARKDGWSFRNRDCYCPACTAK